MGLCRGGAGPFIQASPEQELVGLCRGGAGPFTQASPAPESLRLELLREGLHLLPDPVFHQQLEAAAGVWKVIADEDLLAGLPG